MAPYLRSLAVLLFLASLANAQKPDSREGTPDRLVLERFAVATGGDDLLLPVIIGETKYAFLVDTGSEISVFDVSIPLGDGRGVAVAETPRGGECVFRPSTRLRHRSVAFRSAWAEKWLDSTSSFFER